MAVPSTGEDEGPKTSVRITQLVPAGRALAAHLGTGQFETHAYFAHSKALWLSL